MLSIAGGGTDVEDGSGSTGRAAGYAGQVEIVEV